MRLYEISKGLSVDIDAIEAIEEGDDAETFVFISGKRFTSALPYSTLRNIVGGISKIGKDWQSKSFKQEILEIQREMLKGATSPRP